MSSFNLTVNHNFTIILPPIFEAYAKLDFLFPTASVDNLINNASFADTIGCSFGIQNVSCSEACGNVSEVFSNWPNFYSCSWYPTIAGALSDPSLSDSQIRSFSDKGITSNGSISPSDLSTNIASCLSDYCQSSPDCMDIDKYGSCSRDNLISSNGSLSYLNRTGAIMCLRDSICSSTASVNPDIGGLGVILSVLIQYGLSLGACFLHLIFDLQYRLRKWHHRQKGNTGGMEKLITEAAEVRTKHLEALTSATVELQKQQCFFAATLQIATLIVLPSYGAGQHTRDQILLRLTAANAYVPIVLTLVHIELLGGRSSKYIFLLSVLTYVLGTAAYWVSVPAYEGGFLYLGYDNPTIPVLSCGNYAPFAPCYVGNEFFLHGFWKENSGIFYGSMQGTGLIVWLITSGIMLCRLFSAFIINNKHLDLEPIAKALGFYWSRFHRASLGLMLSHKYTSRWIDFYQHSRTIQSIFKSSRRAFAISIKPTSYLYTQLSFSILALILQLVTMVPVFWFSSNIIATQMTFGQIVAVGIWVPVLLEYGYLEIDGAKEGNEYRLKAPLIVVGGSTPVVSANSSALLGKSQPIVGIHSVPAPAPPVHVADSP